MSYPSVNTLERELKVDRALALKLRRVLDGRLDPEEASVKCAARVAQCYNEPSYLEKVQIAVDDLLGTCGDEGIYPECGQTWTSGSTRFCPAFVYANAGDPYVATLVYDYEDERWRVEGWADAVERHERRCAECRKMRRERARRADLVRRQLRPGPRGGVRAGEQDEVQPMTTREVRYIDCPCCGIVDMTDEDVCDNCFQAGCEPQEGGDYDECQVQRCPDCDTPCSYMTSDEWVDNCEEDDCARARDEGHMRWYEKRRARPRDTEDVDAEA